MKRIFTLFALVSLVLSAYALPMKAQVSTATHKGQRSELLREHIAERANVVANPRAMRMPAETPQPATKDTMEATNLKYTDYNKFGEILEIFEVDPWIEFTASAGKYHATLSVASTKLIGNWTEANLDASYTYVTIINGKDTTEYGITKANIAFDGDTLRGSITLENNLTLVIKWYYVIPEPTRTETLNLDGVVKTAYLADGDFTIEAMDEKETIYVSIDIYADQIVGKYGKDDIYGYYTYVGILDEEGWDIEEYFDYEAGDVTITKKGEEYLIEASLITISDVTGEVVLYNLTITAEEDPGLEYDNYLEGITTKLTNIIMLEGANDEDLGYYAALQAADATTADKVSIETQIIFFCKKLDATTVIPEGEYTIDGSYMPGTVKSSTGYNMWTGVDPSFVGKLEFEAGEAYYTDLWYMMEGKVTVKKSGEKGLHVEIKATNSYNMPINVIIEGNIPEGIEQIETAVPATKTLIDGQLIIRRGENIYNAVGAQL